jgi:predicted PurR-regulated permease PerM
MLSENSKVTSVIEQIDQLINSKNQTTRKENSILELHKKVNRIDQLLERQSIKNDKKNAQKSTKNQESTLNSRQKMTTNSNENQSSVNRKKKTNQGRDVKE